MHGLPAADVAGPPSRLLPVVLSGTALVVLDFFLVNVLVPVVRRDLGADGTALQWLVAGYALTFASGLVLGGRIGDRIGRRRAFVLGLVAFVVTSAGCGLAPTAAVLVGWRLAQGAAAALLLPQVLAVVSTTYHGAARAAAFRAYALVVGLSGVLGQVLGGALVALDAGGLGWRLCFLVNVPVGIVAAVLAGRALPGRRAADPPRLDIAGAVLLAAALVVFVLSCTEGRDRGPGWLAAGLAATLVLLVVFGVVERAVRTPLVAPRLLGTRSFTAGLAVVVAVYAGSSALFLVLAVYLQDVVGLGPLPAGLLFCPYGIAFMIGSTVGSRMSGRLGRHGIALGALLRAAGLVGFAFLAPVVLAGGPVALVVLPLAVEGFGLGTVVGPLVSTVLLDVAAVDAGAASGVLATAQQVGGVVGVATIGGAYLAASGAPGPVVLALAGVALLVAALAQLLPAARPR